jgi:signal transduction histidine kinase
VIELLRQFDLFEGLSDETLRPLAETGREVELATGETLVGATAPVRQLWIVLEGRIEFVRDGVVVSVLEGPTYAGASPLLTGDPTNALGRALSPTRAVAFSGEAFQELMAREFVLVRRVARLMRPVFERAARAASMQERLAGLGQLAAGLAHELNNPAAAARRSAVELEATFETLHRAVDSFVNSGVEREQAAELVRLQHEAMEGAASAVPLDVLTRADREDALADKLEACGLDGYALAGPLVDACVDAAWLDRVVAAAGPAVPAALAWVVASLEARNLVRELHDSTERISELVGAVKEYAYMDRDDVGEVDIHEGLETTLRILAHRLKDGDVRVERLYDPELPRVRAHGSQLNQVWTNLIVNALDALDGRGTIQLRTCQVDGEVLVEVEDDGPGIPAEAQGRIFEPFFTTKDVGKGTGMGLDITRRIVVEGHHGDLRVESRPGRTRFQVRLPLDAAR